MKMDASTSSKVDFNLCSLFLQIKNSNFPVSVKPNNTVVKYTKLPDFDFDAKEWPQKDSYILQPRLRRIVAMNEQDNIMKTFRSLKNNLGASEKPMCSAYSKRKIVTISEDEEGDIPAYSRGDLSKPVSSRSSPVRSHRVNRPNVKPDSPTRRSNYSSSHCSDISRYPQKQDTKPSAKPSFINKNIADSSKPLRKTKTQNIESKTNTQEYKNRYIKDRENTRNNKSANTASKISISKSVVRPSVSEKEILLIKNKLTENMTIDITPKSTVDRSKPNQGNNKGNVLKEIPRGTRGRAAPMIHVPLVNQHAKSILETGISQDRLLSTTPKLDKINCSTETENNFESRDMSVGTDPEPSKIDVVTEIELATIKKRDSNIQTDFMQKALFDSLDIPNVTLLKEKSDISKEDIVRLHSQSLPDLQLPSMKITTRVDDKKSSAVCSHSMSTSYIIGRATLTYTTKKEIDFQVVGNKEEPVYDAACSGLDYPMSVMTVLKKEINTKALSKPPKRDNADKKKNNTNSKYSNNLNTINSHNYSYVFDSSKLVKPSEIISTIRVTNGLLQSDYICEQFQRELNFIDSFFESLQYLESCSLSDKCFRNKKVENWVSKSGFDIKNPEYNSFFSDLENGTNIDDTETMASKSLCLLNLLIRDEQRRAKNLLFVLKMREDALKDFTKSQILWLENKKKQDNIDIPTLKKKQRGALLKLQHECGEMQRMRKALLALSEKRKVALMKTKKNIELNLKNNVTVDQILLGKRKLKRNLISDRSTAPLKCFDLSSSGCDESTTSRPKSESALVVPSVPIAPIVPLVPVDVSSSAEKCVQTGDSLLGSVLVDEATDTAADNFVAVDGGYLNILFHNLSLPEIFSSGKQYEVNEEALKSVVNSANSCHNALSESDIVEKFIDQIKNRDQERSSSPSTARSLVEEFDQYYKGLVEEEKSPRDSPEMEEPSETNQAVAPEPMINASEVNTYQSTSTMTTVCNVNPNSAATQSCDTFDDEMLSPCDKYNNSVKTQALKGKDAMTIATQAGPLPVPAGAVAATETDSPKTLIPKSSSTTATSETSLGSPAIVSSLASLAAPAQTEAEELRRQQLAIEREIKALEQQQCQLLVVREIPDKPPPPYTPPAEPRVAAPPRKFLGDDSVEEKVYRHLTDSVSVSVEPTDAYALFLQDFCKESVAKHKADLSDRPWDACNLLPQKPPLNTDKLVKKTAADLKEVLAGASPTIVSGVGARRSDHIDDILFAEWRRCEPEWTTLHSDEAQVKSQIFEGIFQKILTETIDEYKKSVLTTNFPPNGD
ncbi:uncharacterized protein LOC126379957 isoform X2 [Pectinophora gossypiella]|uniref:uncharacterized protein LOC126379957 isoform X2 n=1 Tax=Pectinophora gossypiella TaxID=13191 RepID=UPI00214E1DE1|nr:uncharacterized protein LOC126379957 isoform X2 [Pectinophora gossypiella]